MNLEVPGLWDCSVTLKNQLASPVQNCHTLPHMLAASMKPPVLFILIDGLGDVTTRVDSNGIGKTPLQAASTRNMDYLAKSGLNGLLDSVGPSLACGSDTAHLSILGYSPWIYYRGRGAFESMGAGIDMEPGDIAFKSNFATMDPETGVIVSRRADRNFEQEGPMLCSYLNGTIIPEYPMYKILVQYATEHRCGVCIRGPDLSDCISGTDPLKDGLALRKCEKIVYEDMGDIEIGQAEHTCRVVQALSDHFARLLTEHPINIQRVKESKPEANIVLLRGCGARRKDLPRFQDLHGMKSFMIAPTCMIAGLGKMLEMDLISVPGATGDYRSDWNAKGLAAINAFKGGRYDFGFLHVKAVDDAGHDGSESIKIKCLESIDNMIGNILQIQEDPMVIVITGDHSTPVYMKDHSNEPVPFCIALINGNAPIPSDPVAKFDEIEAARGSLGRFSGAQVMPLIKKFRAACNC